MDRGVRFTESLLCFRGQSFGGVMKSSFISDAVQWSTKLWIRCCLSEASPMSPMTKLVCIVGRVMKGPVGITKAM